MAENDTGPGGLLAWQWSLYAVGHTRRANLLIHVFAVPVFQLGTLALLASPLLGVTFAMVGPVLMVGAMAAQGRGHAGESERPVRFEGPLDVIARIMLEQWITFPRFVLSGGLAQAWRASAPRNREDLT